MITVTLFLLVVHWYGSWLPILHTKFFSVASSCFWVISHNIPICPVQGFLVRPQIFVDARTLSLGLLQLSSLSRTIPQTTKMPHSASYFTFRGFHRFPKIGVPPVIIHFRGIFPHKPSSYWGTPIYGKPHETPCGQIPKPYLWKTALNPRRDDPSFFRKAQPYPIAFAQLVGGWATPLKHRKVNWDDYSQYMGK